MPKTYTQLMDEIQALQARAEELRQSEVRGVVDRIREAIAAYNLTPVDLFGPGGGRRKAGKTRAASGTPRYADGKGNVWGGRGPRPRWLRDALASGRKLSDFETRGRAGAAAPKARKAASKRKRGGTVKYRDDAGHTWSGFGPKPGWFKEALAAGKTPESMAA